MYSYYKIAEEGLSASSNHYAYGPEFKGQQFYQYGNIDENGQYYKSEWKARDWYKGFYKTGLTYMNSVSIDGSNGKERNIWTSFVF